jgi:hypothetical protein
MAFQHVNQRVIEPFAVGEHGGHELRRLVAEASIVLTAEHMVPVVAPGIR